MAILTKTDARNWLADNAPSRLMGERNHAYQAWRLLHVLTDSPDYRAFEVGAEGIPTEGTILDVQIDPELTAGACGFDGPFSVAVNHRTGDYVAVDTTRRLVALVMGKSARLERKGFGVLDEVIWTDVYIVGRLVDGAHRPHNTAVLADAHEFVRELKASATAKALRAQTGMRQLYIPASPSAYPAKLTDGEWDPRKACTTGVLREIPEDGNLNGNVPVADTMLVDVDLSALVGRKNGDIVQINGEHVILHQPSWNSWGTVQGVVEHCLEEPSYPCGMPREELQCYFDTCYALYAASRLLTYGRLPSNRGPRKVEDIPAHHMAS